MSLNDLIRISHKYGQDPILFLQAAETRHTKIQNFYISKALEPRLPQLLLKVL